MTQSTRRPWLVVLILAGTALAPGAATGAGSQTGDDGRPGQGAPPPPPPQPASEDQAQEEPFPQVPRGIQPGDVQKVFVLQHVRPGYLTRLLRVFPAEISSVEPREGGMSALAVSAKPAVLAAVEETIKRLDQPGTDSPRATANVELTGYVLEGLLEPEKPEPLPPDLEGVVAQLRRTFKYSAYRLLDTVVAQARANGARFQVDGVTETRLSRLAPSYYRLRAQETDVTDTTPRTVRLRRFEFSLEIPVVTGPPPADNSKPLPFQYRSVGLQSDIDVRDGQYVVVGKSGFGASDNALVLILTAKVVD